MAKAGRNISEILETLPVEAWSGPVDEDTSRSAITALEDGKVLYFPHLPFELCETESCFLSPAIADPKRKNVSLDATGDVLKHAVGSIEDLRAFKSLMQRYRDRAMLLVRTVLPAYANALEIGRTSFRPVEISHRRLSAKKDDTRLHIDAFPSTPTGGKRILRVFTNVNPDGQGRDWRIGEPFEDVSRAFAHRLPRYSPVVAKLSHALGVTKSYRTAYDHMMLNIHDNMKADDAYQRSAAQNAFSFPPGSTWVVCTDKVSHAAMGGRHLFEQTLYLPVCAMVDPGKAPVRVLERVRGRALV